MKVPLFPRDAVNLLVTFFGFVVALVIAELCLRAGDVFAPVSVFANVSGLTARDRQTDWDVEYRFNTAGFRGSELPVGPVSDERKRVVVIGDSFVFGQGVGVDEAFPAILQEIWLNSGIERSVWNLGLIGVGPEAYYLVFRDVGVRLRPTLTVLTVFGNDAAAVYQPSGLRVFLRTLSHHIHLLVIPRIVRQRFAAVRGQAVTNSSDLFWRELSARCAYFHSAIECQSFIELFTSRFGFEINNLAAACLGDPLEVARWIETEESSSGWVDFSRYLEKIRDLAVSNNSKLVIAVIADGPQVDQRQLSLRRQLGVAYRDDVGIGVGRFQELVAALGAELGIPVFDSSSSFRKSQESLFFESDLHWNAAGHRLFATELAQFIDEGKFAD